MSRRPALSLSVYLADRSVLLVGSGEGARERAERLRAAQARLVHLVESEWSEELQGEHFAVIAHSEDDDLNQRVAAWGRTRGALVYAHDRPEHSDFAFPALARRGALQLAIATEGTAPALASRLRQELQSLLDGQGPALDRLLASFSRLRSELPRGPERVRKARALAGNVRISATLEIDPAAEEPD